MSKEACGQAVLAGAATLAGQGLMGFAQLAVSHAFFALLLDILHSRQSQGCTSEELLHVSGLHACLDERGAQFFGMLLPLLDGYLPLVGQVCQVAHQHDDDVAAPLFPENLMSLTKVLSILFIFSKNNLLVSFIFTVFFFISLISALIFMTSLLLLT